MKHIFFFSLVLIISFSVAAQGKSKEKTKTKTKTEKVKVKNKVDTARKKHEDIVWEGTSDNYGKGPKPSKNQPAKVRASFRRDYPNAVNVSWSKYRGDWTATFGNGIFTSTAVYHANGDRRDTRTPVQQSQVPRNIFDSIFKRRPQIQLGDIIKINVPQAVTDIFRIKTILDGTSRFVYYDANGKEVTYNY